MKYGNTGHVLWLRSKGTLYLYTVRHIFVAIFVSIKRVIFKKKKQIWFTHTSLTRFQSRSIFICFSLEKNNETTTCASLL